MSTFSIKLSDDKIKQLKDTFKDYIKDNPNEYIDTFIQKQDITISIYKTNKVVFQGNDAFFYASAYIDNKKIRQAGSDEVGTGDVFGPVVICASIVEEDDFDYIEQMHITDSKQLNDDYIMELAPELMKKFKHSLLVLDNETYNRVHEKYNLNAIKAKMHNKAYLNMIDKGYDIPKACYVDQFCSEYNYYEYLKDEERIYRNLIFETKAEEKYPAVAIGSIISRYAFLMKMKQLNEKYGIKLHRGATESENIDNDIKTFINKYGLDELKMIGKLHFKNFDKYLRNGDKQ